MRNSFGTTALVPARIAGEALRSLHSRALSFNRGHQQAIQFGPRRARWNQPDWSLPTGLEAYAEMFGDVLGLRNGIAWVNQHTLAPYFGATQTAEKRAAFEARLLTVRPGPRRPLLPIAASEWFVPCPRLCVECDEESVERYGFSHVPRAMLIPFLTRCPVHRTMLEEFPDWTPLWRGQARQSRCMPGRAAGGVALTEGSVRLLDDSGELLEELGSLLQTRGMTGSKGRLRRTDLAELLMKHATGRYEHPELDRIVTSVAGAERAIASLARGRGCFHPGVTIALVLALRDAPEVAQAAVPLRRVPTTRLILDKALSECSSPTAAAKAARVSVQTAIGRAREVGIACSSRPKVFDAAARTGMLGMLERGIPPHVVARKSKSSLSTVYRVARAAPQRSEKAKEERHAKDVEEHVAAWNALTAEHPGLTRSELRALKPALYAWLYRNARQRLQSLEPLPQPRSGGRAHGNDRTTDVASRAPAGADFALARRLSDAASSAEQLDGARASRTALLAKAGRRCPKALGMLAGAELLRHAETAEKYVRRRLATAGRRLMKRGLPLIPWRVIKEARLRPQTVAQAGVCVETEIRRLLANCLKQVGNG